MKFSCKVVTVHLFCHFMLHLREGSAENIGKTTVNSGDTANLFYNSVNESSENFRGYRVKKKNETFRALRKGSDTSQCIDGHLKDLCPRTEFKRQNESHLVLRIKDTVLNDSGVYAVHGVFKTLTNDTSEEVVLEVTDLNITGTNMSSNPTEDQDKSYGSSEATSFSTTASSSHGLPSAPVLVLLMFATMCVMISI